MLRVGVPREIKVAEKRVSLTPSTVRKLTTRNIRVTIEKNAGLQAGFPDAQYESAGAQIASSAMDVFEQSDLIVKVKEPQPSEYALIQPHHTLFTFFHFAGVPGLAEAMADSGARCIAYETMKTPTGIYPILAPMSIIAGEQAILEGMKHMGVHPDEAVATIIGAGNVGSAAASMAKVVGFERIIVMDKDLERLALLPDVLRGVERCECTPANLRLHLPSSHLVVGSIYTHGKAAGKIISRDLLCSMPRGGVFVDVSIDQGGMTEESRARPATDPVVDVGHVKLYCVPNMPGQVPQRASSALSRAVEPYVLMLAIHGPKIATATCYELQRGAEM